MKSVFIDTWYLIGIAHPRDQSHGKAKTVSATLTNIRLITSQAILMEFLNYFSKKGEHLRNAAVKIIRTLEGRDNVEIVDQSKDLFEDAFNKYEQYRDKEWSLTDCISFVIMREKNIQEALTDDHNFEQAQFRIFGKEG
jgi:predicted nucleic acid-binding protein